MGEEDAPALATLCRRLDGIPLALELAAARVGMLTIGQITDRLEDRFELLTRGGRTAPLRQQTLLSDAERDLFGKLSVFAGGFSLEEVEEVCAGDGIEQWGCWTCSPLWPTSHWSLPGNRAEPCATGCCRP